VSVRDQLLPAVKDQFLNYERPNEESVQEVYRRIFTDAERAESVLQAKTTGNPVIDMVNLLFGTEGLMNLRSPENRNLHPLAQLAGVGKSLIESAVMNIGIGAGSGAACAAGSSIGCSGMSAAFSIAGLGLTIGFILFYVVPFLPFVYFFFAVGNWVKSIFEAMVGAPLWALGHMRLSCI